MRVTNYSFPHPVLGHADDIAGQFGVEFKEELGREKILLHYRIELKSETLAELIKNKIADIVCEINCPYTLYRKTFKIKAEKQIIELNAEDLRGKVEVDYYVTAKEDINGYKPSGINSEYENAKFDVSKGEILAIDPRNGNTYFIADKTYEQFVSASSFMQVVRQEDVGEGPVEYVSDDDKILIRLPEKDFDKYNEIYTDDSFPAVYHAVLALPALTVALSEALSDGKEDLKERLWYQHVLQIRENNNKIKAIPWERDYSVYLAQAILRLPISRSFENISDHISILDEQG